MGTRIRSSNRIIEIDGERKCLADWAEEYGISKHTIRDRIKRGMEPEDAVILPVRSYRKRATDGSPREQLQAESGS